MISEKQGFPDDRDRELQTQAERISMMADDLVEWVGEHAGPRQQTAQAISADQEFDLLRLRRLASNLRRSADVPVAAAVYGASQVGKSLFMGRVLEAADECDSPLGQSDQLSAPAYIRELSFQWDINPQCGSNEATALVTRFTTKDRFDSEALPEYPVKVRALTRAEWIRVLARGFRSECHLPSQITWNEGQLRRLFEEAARDFPADAVDREWRIDLLDAYAYLRNIDPRLYVVEESMLNAFISQYPLSQTGYVEIVGRMFWDSQNFRALTDHFNDVCRFLDKITANGRDGILLHWAAVKFLLDSQRSPIQESPESRWLKKVSWTDLREGFRDGWYVIDFAPGAGGPTDDLAIVQSAMLELILPVIPHRLKEDWREVIQRMDLLDLPGMVAGGGDTEGRADSIESMPEKMNVVKRGKVFYLIDRYLEERQIQAFLVLVRYGVLNVRQLLKEYVDKWGRIRYGDEAWPTQVVAKSPSLFLGLTGIDDEFKDRPPNRYLYDNRLNQLVHETLREVMTDYSGRGKSFTNVFPIRYPGTWDFDEPRRTASGQPRKWQEAREIFLESKLVQQFVEDAALKWDLAMQDNDGGLSLICKGFIACNSSRQKQDALEQEIRTVREKLRNLAEAWYYDTDANQARQKRRDVAQKVLNWLADEQCVYERVHALQAALCFDEGNAMEVAEFAESRGPRLRARPEPVQERFPAFLRDLLDRWSRELTTRRWLDHASLSDNRMQWLPAEEFGMFSRFLCDYICSKNVFDALVQRLLPIVNLSIRDASDRRHAQREYVRAILNDFVLNPGPEDQALGEPCVLPEGDLGLMTTFCRRWRDRLAESLASAAGEHVQVPSGNEHLRQTLDNYFPKV